jgi:cellulose synthase/poly-beta-1,6-N-acetylglucosamine synthase-like glycosyltransferase
VALIVFITHIDRLRVDAMYVLISLDIQYLIGFSTFIMTCKFYAKCNVGDQEPVFYRDCKNIRWITWRKYDIT